MVFVKLKQYPYESYSCVDWSDENISILGRFFSSDLGCPGTSLDDWIFNNDEYDEITGNCMALEKKGHYIYITHQYDPKKKPTKLKISKGSFFNLLQDWQNKVCKKNPRPQEVMIKYENNIFTLETSDTL